TGDKVDGADPRFGSGTIYLIGGATTSDYAARIGGSANGAKIYAPIVASGNVVFTAETSEQEVHFFGDISGSGIITDNIGYTFFLKGDNSAYTGDWYIPQDYVCVTPGESVHVPEADRNFGSGTVYLNGGGLRTVNTSTPVTLDASIVVVSGKTAGVRYGALTFTGDVTVEGTLSSQTGDYGDPTLTFTDGGILQGTGHVNGRAFVTDGGTLTAGTVGTTGTLTLDRTLEMAEGSTLRVDILSPADYDKIIVKGAAELADDMLIDLFFADESLLAAGNTFDILTVGADSVLPELSSLSSILSPEYADLFNISFANGVLSLTVDGSAVPEPSAWILMLVGMGILAARRKRTNVSERF
ncbi:MAG: PEP-CTERM sorting domain-containing protein, partial [Thermoguttaceae bacterium]|nr:PEP-CTERM sorting domain-containing protein [Thermoguttaceae bacterium]